MAKGLGKVILTSSILAGAALGSYMYFKKEGVIDETKTPAENVQKIKSKVTSDAAEFFSSQDRTYVDLNDTVETVKEKATEVVETVKEKASEVVEKAAEKVSETAEKVAAFIKDNNDWVTGHEANYYFVANKLDVYDELRGVQA